MTEVPVLSPVAGDGTIDLGERLRAIRLLRRRTLKAVAEAAGVSESFLSQLERGRTSASVASLQRLLREEVGDGWTELSCHPGYASPDYTAVYLNEREAEVQTLTDARIRHTNEDLLR